MRSSKGKAASAEDTFAPGVTKSANCTKIVWQRQRHPGIFQPSECDILAHNVNLTLFSSLAWPCVGLFKCILITAVQEWSSVGGNTANSPLNMPHENILADGISNWCVKVRGILTQQLDRTTASLPKQRAWLFLYQCALSRTLEFMRVHA